MIYLDNAAAAPPSKNVIDHFASVAFELFPNQEAIHSAGYAVRKKLDQISKNFAGLIDSKNKSSVFWVNSGTEGLNCVFAHPFFAKGNIVTTLSEHAALLESVKSFKETEVRIVNLRADGQIDTDHFLSLLDENTTAIAIHHVQSETGVIQDLVSLRILIDGKAPKAKFVVDTVQAIGKVYIPWNEARIDFCFIAGHKIGCPSGGAVVYRDTAKIFSTYFTMIRSERHAVSRPEPSAVSTLNFALEDVITNFSINQQNAEALNDQLRTGLASIKLPAGSVTLSVATKKASPYIIHCTIPGFQAAVLLRFLAAAKVMVSSGSACEAETKEPSRALTAMGFDKAKAYSGLRISLWTQTTKEDIKTLLSALQQAINDY